MKRILWTVLALFTVTVFPAGAQEFSFGPKLGLNVSTLTGDDADGAKAKVNMHAGLFGEYQFSGVWAFEGALLYSNQGAKVKHTDTRLNLNTLNIPLLVKAYVAQGFNVYAGPQVGFLLSAKAKDDDVSVKVSDGFKTVDLGLVLGVGYQFDWGLRLYADYDIGLTNLPKKVGGESSRMKNGVFQIGAGWRF